MVGGADGVRRVTHNGGQERDEIGVVALADAVANERT
jgi:hypothetical protein